MVRVNLILPKKLADQHLIAEYNELLMLAAYIRKYPGLENLPKRYCLGKGHMTFFKNKASYLKRRHENLKAEMRKRGFKARKSLHLQFFHKDNKGDWKATKEDLNLITKRIISKLQLKPTYYRYYGKYKSAHFFMNLLRQ